MITENRNIAIAYDFDGTLAPGNMQEYNFIPDINMDKGEFWEQANELARKHDMDEVLAYMHLMLIKAREQNLDIREETFMKYGAKITFFEGVETYFERINKYAESKNLHLEHFIISSGLREIVKGTSIARHFKTIYASGFQYDETGIACWPALGVNYTNKTQFLFRINKGIYNSYDNSSINKAMPENMRVVPFSNLIYLGDGETDVPAMKMVNLYGGTTIAVYNPHSTPTPEKPVSSRENCVNIIRQNRADHIGPADYTEGSELDTILKKVIDRISVEQDLLHIMHKEIENANQ
ncbi:MAG: HAD family hydrolase [Bacteroidales bacterium]|nr:HAD family hydrolase [Bacteroidales bacterium]MDY6347520.1 HAD family hydrolase [Bacteroidales bacterium]